jgi:DNA-binding transcriptional ArsR family regulator
MPPSTSELMSAVRHPLRRRILRAYLDGSIDCPSASELAEVMNQGVGHVAYHLKTLAKLGILSPVQESDGENPKEPHYGWTLGVEPDWLRMVLEVWAASDVSN